jgi:serine/threonine protein kinase
MMSKPEEKLTRLGLAEEPVAGRELKSLLDEGKRLSLVESVRIMRGLLAALEVVHRARIVHRDVKPANIVLGDRASVKLRDFGIALDLDQPPGDEAGGMAGTPAYMAPEQFLGGNVDHRSDLFSAGVVFYILLTGRHPFAGRDSIAVMKRILQDELPPPSTIEATLPKALDGVAMKALAKNADLRFASAREFSDALAAALSQPASPGARPAAYFHVLSHPGASTNFTLCFKDLSEDQLRMAFQPFPIPSRRDVSVIRTERPHDAEATDVSRKSQEQADEFMRQSGQFVDMRHLGDAAIMGAGVNITEAFLREMEGEPGNRGLTPGDLY